MYLMTVQNSRENILKHENEEYINSRPKWIIGRIPDLSDYRKLSVDSMDEAMKLAALGAKLAPRFVPVYHGKPMMLYFTQALSVGASMIDRRTAESLGLDFEKYRSVLLVCPSRYGKSLSQAISCIGHAGAGNKEVNIGAGTIGKAQIIQQKIVEMLPFTNKRILDGLIVDSNGATKDKYAKIERMATQVSKQGLRWKGGGSIGLFSTNETQKNTEVSAGGAIGIGGDYCVDGDCEVLTKTGWKKLAQLEDMVEVAQYTKDGKIEFVIPSRVIRKHYKGQGFNVSFVNGAKNVFMIPQHRQPLMNPKGDVVIREIKDVKFYDYWNTILAGEGVGSSELTPYERLIIACQADGCILKRTERGNYFQIKVKKERKAKRLEKIFQEAEMDVKIHLDKRGYYVCHFYMVYSCDKILPHAFGWSVSSDKGRSILNELVEWDGYRYPDGTIYYSSTNEENVAWVQAIAAQSGYRSHKSVQHDYRSDKFQDIHRIYCKPSSTRRSSSCTKETTDWDDMVYCVTVPSGMFIIRKGDVTITGNCVIDEVQLMSPVGFRTASRFMVENPDTKRFCVGNPMINGHFKELYDDPTTFVIHMNEVTAIIEGRMSRKGIALTGIPSYSDEYRYYIETEFPNELRGNRFFTHFPIVYDKAKMPEVEQKWYFLGIDSAYSGGDSLVATILSFNKSLDKSWFVLEDQIDLKKGRGEWTSTTTLEISLDILKLYEKYSFSMGCIDIGFGIHIYERLRSLAPSLPLEPIDYSKKPTQWRNSWNVKKAANKRAELHLDLRDLCANELLYVDNRIRDELVRQMREVSQAPAQDTIRIELKKNIKARLGRSPDEMDSACLAIHAAVLSGILGSKNKEEEDYNINDIMRVF